MRHEVVYEEGPLSVLFFGVRTIALFQIQPAYFARETYYKYACRITDVLLPGHPNEIKGDTRYTLRAVFSSMRNRQSVQNARLRLVDWPQLEPKGVTWTMKIKRGRCIFFHDSLVSLLLLFAVSVCCSVCAGQDRRWRASALW